MEEALRDLGTFAFTALHLFSACGRHSSAVAELLRLIERLEELHTEVQEMTSSPHLVMTLLSNMLRWWALYLNRCVAALASESLDALGCQVPFLLKPILVELEGGQYAGPIPPMTLEDLVSRANGRGGGGGGSGATATKKNPPPQGGCKGAGLLRLAPA